MGGHGTLFQEFVKKVGAERIILTRCEDMTHIQNAQKLGINLFQGFFVEHMLDKNTSTK